MKARPKPMPRVRGGDEQLTVSKLNKRRAAMRELFHKDDTGSGVSLAFAVLAAVAFIAFALMCGASYLACSAHVRNAAEQIALAGAYAVQAESLGVDASANKAGGSSSSVCSFALAKVHISNMKMENCVVEGEDVQVKVSGKPSLAFLPRVSVSSRAGPAQCVPENR